GGRRDRASLDAVAQQVTFPAPVPTRSKWPCPRTSRPAGCIGTDTSWPWSQPGEPRGLAAPRAVQGVGTEQHQAEPAAQAPSRREVILGEGEDADSGQKDAERGQE